MANGISIAMSNPISPAADGEFNSWYNDVHGKEVTGLAGFASMTRYKAQVQVVPPGSEPTHRYLALYELSDVDAALHALADGADKFKMSDTVDLAGAVGIAFTKIFSTKD